MKSRDSTPRPAHPHDSTSTHTAPPAPGSVPRAVTTPSSSQGPPGLGVDGTGGSKRQAVMSLTNRASGGGDVGMKDMVIGDMDSEPRKYLNSTVF